MCVFIKLLAIIYICITTFIDWFQGMMYNLIYKDFPLFSRNNLGSIKAKTKVLVNHFIHTPFGSILRKSD